jgi:hypothetical protein
MGFRIGSERNCSVDKVALRLEYQEGRMDFRIERERNCR